MREGKSHAGKRFGEAGEEVRGGRRGNEEGRGLDGGGRKEVGEGKRQARGWGEAGKEVGGGGWGLPRWIDSLIR